MIKLNTLLCGLIVAGGITHAGYSFLVQERAPNGTYFSTGVFIMSDGSTTPANLRMQLDNNNAYDFIQVGAWHHDFFRKIESRVSGNLKLKTVSASPSQEVPAPAYSDEDIVFNKAYSSKQGTTLTLYALPHDQNALCFYIKELSKVRCVSQNRPRSLHP
ncbi:hypothetical protein [Pseudomonas sp. 6D_7.1_Bac1]|jgi:hypothetical protein|uniref:hypothetical protein n=1 Tax=Pseudomonas sp. 6D_7.1_Bac1 TaxID=2971615 RepID=UPI0021C8966E|nr:hypothetical protein [Pseudomonas sp. 6D_7.1_Bac1]MCU1750247.1 hypothetical protein [Pseudomonas sp. 6D_7.1_Bac1]